jgi:hypothetical protein
MLPACSPTSQGPETLSEPRRRTPEDLQTAFARARCCEPPHLKSKRSFDDDGLPHSCRAPLAPCLISATSIQIYPNGSTGDCATRSSKDKSTCRAAWSKRNSGSYHSPDELRFALRLQHSIDRLLCQI